MGVHLASTGADSNEQTTQESINSCKSRYKRLSANDDNYAVALAA